MSRIRAMVVIESVSSNVAENDIINTTHWVTNGIPGTGNGLIEAADGIAPRLFTFYRALAPRMVTDARVREIRFYDLDEATAPGEPKTPVVRVPSPAIVGTASSQMPRESSIVVSWRTDLRTRRGRGRTYLGPVGQNTLDAVGGIVLATVRAEIRTAVLALLTDPNPPDGPEMGVYSRVNNTIQRIVGGYIDAEFDAQQRRAYPGSSQQRTEFEVTN